MDSKRFSARELLAAGSGGVEGRRKMLEDEIYGTEDDEQKCSVDS